MERSGDARAWSTKSIAARLMALEAGTRYLSSRRVAREGTTSAAASLALLSPTVLSHPKGWFWRASVGKTQPMHEEKDGEKPPSVNALLMMVWELSCLGRGRQREFFLLR